MRHPQSDIRGERPHHDPECDWFGGLIVVLSIATGAALIAGALWLFRHYVDTLGLVVVLFASVTIIAAQLAIKALIALFSLR